ncbi:MAG: AI-2E family transporter [Patescibacteria group bacterium]|jgi:predicted PurR-regulated permease PerM
MTKQNMTISNGTIWRIILILALVAVVIMIRDVLALFVVAVVLASAFDPWVDGLYKIKIPRGLSIAVIFLIFLSIITLVVILLAGPIADQIMDISRSFPQIYAKINTMLASLHRLEGVNPGSAQNTSGISLSQLAQSLSQIGSGIFNVVTSVFGGIFSFFMVLVITFYLTIEENGFKKFIRHLFPVEKKEQVNYLVEGMQKRLGMWFRGQMILSVIIFLAVYIGLVLLHVKYALLLAVLAGLLEIVPILGPWISAIIAIFFAWGDSFNKALYTGILYLAIQQLENHVVVPKVMGKSTGLNPIVVILAILTGGRLAGIIGALLAVPIATAISVYFEYAMAKRK